MSPYPAEFTLSTVRSVPNSTSSVDGTPKNDHRMLVVVIFLGIAGAILVAFIIRITLRLKGRQDNGEVRGPCQGTLIHTGHPAAHITPFGNGGPHSGWNAPRYRHSSSGPLRIALRRPDGAWHFADSRTPYSLSGVTDLDVLPSPISSSASLFSLNTPTQFSSLKAQEAQTSRAYDFEHTLTVPPPPAYHSEPCREHFDRSPTSHSFSH